MQTHVLYHAECPDGFASAFVAWLALGDTAVYHPVSYGQPLPEIADGAKVYIVDFSYPRAVLMGLQARCPKLVVLDHHKTAQADLLGLDFATFDTGKSGAVLTWEHFCPGLPVPEMLLYVQDRDLWQWKLKDSKEINAGLWRTRLRRFKIWQFILEQWDAAWPLGKSVLQVTGSAVLDSDRHMINALVAERCVMEVAGQHVLAVNTPLLQSEVGHALCKLDPGRPFSVAWSLLADGAHYRYSLRSIGEFDVSAVAKVFGGGGHKNAAGFTCTQLLHTWGLDK